MIPLTVLQKQRKIDADTDPTCVAYNSLLRSERRVPGAKSVSMPGYPEGALRQMIASSAAIITQSELADASTLVAEEAKVDVRTAFFPAKLSTSDFATKSDPPWIREFAAIAEGLDSASINEACGSALPAKSEGININNWRI